VTLTFHREMTFEYGRPAALSPMVRRVIARNPSAFTFHGTGTYIVGHGDVAVIDPGPARPDHVEALLAAVSGEKVTDILITHTHIDHSPATAALKAATGARTWGFGPHPAAEEDVEEGGDRNFLPDTVLRDGDTVAGNGWTFTALHTPGHISNHLCFALAEEKALFSGDHVMGWSTSVISPPDGSMADYFASLRRLLSRDDQLYYPTHGPPIPHPQAFVAAYIAHREERERQILACLAQGLHTIPQMVAAMYRDVPAYLHGPAARSVLAHLIHMAGDGRIRADRPPSLGSHYDLP
jgi:glyoxylase-like metal-dependent hydrolase (beta-lactamase superfamily II)